MENLAPDPWSSADPAGDLVSIHRINILWGLASGSAGSTGIRHLCLLHGGKLVERPLFAIVSDPGLTLK